MKITFIGLGSMGTPIAANLLKIDPHLTVFNRTKEKTDPLVKLGATASDSIHAAVGNCDAVFTMLSDDVAVTDVVFCDNGIAAALPRGSVHVSLSTISVATARKLAEEHRSRKQLYVSAPVFGRPNAAETKRLLVVAAGETSIVEGLRPLLDAIGRRTYLAGVEPWQANLIKLNGNFMIACVLESFGETFATMRKAGVDHHLFYEIMTELFGSPVYQGYGAAIAAGKFEPAGFALKLGLKDIRLGLEAAAELNAPMPFASVLRDHFVAAMANGQDQMDWSSISQIPALMAGLKTI